MSVAKAKALAQNIGDDAAREAILALCADMEQAQREIRKLQDEVHMLKGYVHSH